MGQRICYFIDKGKRTLKELVINHYTHFRAWYIKTREECLIEYGEEFGKIRLIAFFENNEVLPSLELLDKNLIDELTSEFIGHFCDYGDGNDWLELLSPTISKWKYEGSTLLVEETQEEEFIRLWNYVIKGRSLKDNNSFESYSNDYAIGFLNIKEQVTLYNFIKSYFGDIEDMQRKFWTKIESSNFKKAEEMAKKTQKRYLMLVDNPISTGLECVYQVLDEIKRSKMELIITIDGG